MASVGPAAALCLLVLGIVAREARGQHAPDFVARPIDGEPAVGQLVALETPWRISLQAEDRQPLDGNDLISLRRRDHPPISGPSGSQVVLANGDRIRALAHRATQEMLEVNSELLGDVAIPLERVLAVILNPPADRVHRELFLKRLMTGRRKRDIVILGNGDELEGTLVGLDETRVHFEGARGRVEIERSGVQGIALSSELLAFPEPPGLYADALLADGSQLALLDARLDGPYLRGHAAFGVEISTPAEQLIELAFRNGRLAYLSDLEPAEYRHTSYLTMAYPYQRDSSVLGSPMSMRGQLYAKGLGMHSRSELMFGVDGYSRFEATVGIDDETAGLGSAIFRVLLDGETVWESDPATGSSPPQPVRIELRGAQQLTLVVDFGDQGHVQDHADWAEARLVR